MLNNIPSRNGIPISLAILNMARVVGKRRRKKSLQGVRIIWERYRILHWLMHLQTLIISEEVLHCCCFSCICIYWLLWIKFIWRGGGDLMDNPDKCLKRNIANNGKNAIFHLSLDSFIKQPAQTNSLTYAVKCVVL